MSKLSDAVRRASLAAAIGLPLVLTACGGGGGSNDNGGGGSAPMVVSTSPADGETGVPLNRELSVTFSAEMDCATVTAGSFKLSQGGGAVSGTVSCTGNGASFKPDAPLAPGAAHTAAVTAAVKDKAGHALQASSWSFTTGAAPDVTPPEVLSTLPASGDTGVPTNTSVSVVFSEPMDCTTLTASTLVLHDAGGAGVDGTVSCGGSTATLTPAAELAGNTSYTAAVTTGAEDGAGNALATGYSWSFTTGAAPDRTPPTVASTSPESNATGIAPETDVSVTFSEPVDCSTVTIATFTLKTVADSPVAGSVVCSDQGATFRPSAPLAFATEYVATVAAGVKDLAGNALGSDRGWHFTTGADIVPPTILSTLPVNGAVGVPTNAPVSVTFSEPMDCATVTTSSLQLRDVGGASVSGAVSCSGSSATFTPAAELVAHAVYIATVTSAAKDAAGNALAGGRAWNFTTGAAPDRTPPTVVSTIPTSDAVEVATDTSVSVTFSEPVDCSTVTAATFTVKTASDDPVAGTVACADKGATFWPSARLTRSTLYVATLAAAVKDLAGNSLGTEQSWRFTSQAHAWDVATLMEGADGEVDDPQVAVNDAGAAVTVWVQSDAANQKHLWLSLHPSGGSWSAPEEVESLAGDAGQPQVVVDANGDSLVAWTQTDSAGPAVWTRVRAANGAWGGAWKLWGYAPALGIDGSGNVTCVWKHSDGTRINAWASRYPLGTAPLTGGWKAAETIEADDSRSVMFRLSVAVNRDGDATAVWTFYDKTVSQYTVTANRYSAASDSWGSAVDVIPGDIKAPVDPTVVMNDAGEAMAVWRKEYATTYGYATVAFYSLYSGTGASAAWGAWGSLSTMNGLLARAPAVVGNGRGDVFVVWEETYTAYYRRYQAGVGWGPETYLASNVDRPAAALDASGNTMVAWGSHVDGSLRARRYSATAAAWDEASAIVGGASTAMLPAIASDSSGVVTAVWLQWDGSRHNLLANRFE